MLKEILREKGIKQADMAKAIGLTPQAVSLIVNGKQVVDEVLQIKIADFLEVSVGEVFINDCSDPEVDPSLHDEEGSEDGKKVSYGADPAPVNNKQDHVIKNNIENPLFLLDFCLKKDETKLLNSKQFKSNQIQRAIELCLIVVVE